MPELPEVETIRLNLIYGTKDYPSILGTIILRAVILWDRSLATPAVDKFPSRVEGQALQSIGRRGKYLVLKLTRDFLLIHLRMSGDILIESEDESISVHHRMILYLDNGYRLAFNDPRKFGRVWLVADAGEILSALGPEPLDESLTSIEFHRRITSHHRQLKPLLLDQSFFAGMGNIYTDEALHLALLHPLLKSDQLTLEESDRLLQSIRQVLNEGIKRSGASIDWVYRGGDFQNYFRVYQRTGKPCYRCGNPIVRIVSVQRGTHFCSHCQPLKE